MTREELEAAVKAEQESGYGLALRRWPKCWMCTGVSWWACRG